MRTENLRDNRLLNLRLLLAIVLCLALPSVSWAEESDAGDSEGDGGEDSDEELPPWAEGEGDGGEASDSEGDQAGDEVGTEMGENAAGKDGAEAEDADVIPVGQWKSGGMLGLGFSIGTANGLAMKIWPAQMHGIVVTLGAPPRLNSLAVGLSYRIHPKAVTLPGSKVVLHPNLGPAFRVRMFVYSDGTYVDGLGGLAVGLSATIADAPAEFYMDVVPGVTFGINIPGTGIGFDVAGRVGARLYL